MEISSPSQGGKMISMDLDLPILPPCASEPPKVPYEVVIAWCEQLLPQFQITAEEALRDKIDVEFKM